MTEAAGAQTYDVDVAMISDLRLPGGTTSSIAEEVRAQSEAGLSTALIHAAGTVTTYPNPWSAHIQGILDAPGVQIASPRAALHAKVLIIRHPTVIASTPARFEHLTADHVVVVVNHAAIDAAGVQHYDVETTDARVRRLFGRTPIWAPIGPVVRRTVLQQTQRIPLREKDWLNIFRMPGGARRRTGFLGERPIIGRHSRPQPGKWPDTKRDILAAYPDSETYQVEILGGAQIAEKLIGRVPHRWNVVPFGGEDPWQFLQRIDFWVYMHHPDLKEAFGRAAMEALAAGCVAIMPPYMSELFGDAAVYGRPQDVTGIIDSFWADPQKYLEQSWKAQEFAASYNPEMHIRRLEEFGVNRRAPVPGADDVDPSAAAEQSVPASTTAAGQPAQTASAPAPRAVAEETSWHQTLEQWATAYYGTEQLAVRSTMDFAPKTAPIPGHFYDLPVLMLVMTRQHRQLHAAFCESVEIIREATYGFRPVVFTDAVSSEGLSTMDWAVEQCFSEEDWHAFSAKNWLTETAEHLMWAQQQYGASHVLAPDSTEALQDVLTHLVGVCRAPQKVLRTAQKVAARLVEERTREDRTREDRTTTAAALSARGAFGEPVSGCAEGSAGASGITVRRSSEAYGLLLGLRTPQTEQLVDVVGTQRWNTVLFDPALFDSGQVDTGQFDSGALDPAPPDPAPASAGLPLGQRLIHAAVDAVSPGGPVLWVGEHAPGRNGGETPRVDATVSLTSGSHEVEVQTDYGITAQAQGPQAIRDLFCRIMDVHAASLIEQATWLEPAGQEQRGPGQL